LIVDLPGSIAMSRLTLVNSGGLLGGNGFVGTPREQRNRQPGPFSGPASLRQLHRERERHVAHRSGGHSAGPIRPVGSRWTCQALLARSSLFAWATSNSRSAISSLSSPRFAGEWDFQHGPKSVHQQYYRESPNHCSSQRRPARRNAGLFHRRLPATRTP